MKRFDADAEFPNEGPEGERLKDFVKQIWERVVPRSGECVSVQAEVVRAVDRMASEYFRNGLCNYYVPGQPFPQNRYAGWFTFALDTLLANAGEANSAADLEPLRLARARLEADFARNCREAVLATEQEERDLTPAEVVELETLEGHPERIEWESLLNRAERCAANYCVANPALIARTNGRPVKEGGFSDLTHLFEPPPPPAKCPHCGGKGFVQRDEGSWPERCVCTG